LNQFRHLPVTILEPAGLKWSAMVEGVTTPATDLSLYLTVLRCQAGDERAFVQLHEQFGGRTLRYLRGVLGDFADDVQQEVWLSVFRRIRDLNAPGTFRTWLFRITRHRAIDELRRTKRDRELFVPVPETLPHDEGEPDLHSETIDTAVLEAALHDLPTPQREVLILRFQNDLSYREIALVLGCAVGTVRSRLHYAKQSLMNLKGRPS
jgi:RNA polymerase sigma-70 factor (ECF subfamily)